MTLQMLEAVVSVEFKSKGKKIVGNLDYTFNFNGSVITDKFYLYGGFLYDSYLRLNYEHIDEAVQQFGSVVFKLCPMGKTMEGKFVGFGSRANKIIKADIELQKLP